MPIVGCYPSIAQHLGSQTRNYLLTANVTACCRPSEADVVAVAVVVAADFDDLA